MIVEDYCDVCSFTYNSRELIMVNGRLMCSCCVKQHVACLEAKIERLEEENKSHENGWKLLKKIY